MPATPVEEAVRANCDAVMQGDLVRAMGDFTPDALAGVMSVAGAIAQVPSLLGYNIDSHDIAGDDHVFRVTFQTGAGNVAVRATWQDIDDAWKITAIAIDGL